MCGLYLPGHCVHWIQARLGWEDTENLPEEGRLVDVGSDGTLIVDVGEEVRRLWNHQPERISDAAARRGDVVFHQPRWGLLAIPQGASRYLFCVAPSESSHRPCPVEAPTGTPAELLRTAGGFSIPANELRGD